LKSTNTTTTVTKPLFSNSLSSQQQHNEIFIPNKVKLEPINRSQLIIKSSNEKKSSSSDEDDDDDDQEPVNMSKKEDLNDDNDDEEEENVEENHQQSTRNLLTNVSSSVHA
jgi:hypothetical protein